MSWLFIAAEGLGLGGSLIVAIGAQNAFVLRQGLRQEKVGWVASICFFCDAALILAGAAGLGTLVTSYPIMLKYISWGGALYLIWFGLRSIRQALKPEVLTVQQAESNTGQVIGKTLAVSLLNPHVYLDTVVLAGSVAAHHPWPERWAFIIGAALASAIWFYGVGFGASSLAPILARRAIWRAIDLSIALVMFCVASVLIRSALAL